jgi:hypothetical protein
MRLPAPYQSCCKVSCSACAQHTKVCSYYLPDNGYNDQVMLQHGTVHQQAGPRPQAGLEGFLCRLLEASL